MREERRGALCADDGSSDEGTGQRSACPALSAHTVRRPYLLAYPPRPVAPQNASRHGPISWLLAEVVDRNLRWVEHNVSMPHMAAAAAAAAAAGSATAAVAGGGSGGGAGGGGGGGGGARLMPHQADSRGCWDQFLFGDVVLTGMTGERREVGEAGGRWGRRGR